MDKNLRELLAQMGAIIDSLEAQLGDVPAALERVRMEGFEAGKLEGDAAGYARGFEEGKASVVCPVPDEDRKFTQADLDAAVEAVRAALTQEMEGLRQAITALQGELAAAKADVDQRIVAAVAAAIVTFKAELKAKYAEAQAKEALEEAAFGAMLDEVIVPEPIPEPIPEPEPAPAPIEEQPAPPLEDTQV